MESISESKGVGKESMQESVSKKADSFASQIGDQITSVGSALNESGSHLRDEGKGTPAKVVEEVGARADEFGQYLKHNGASQLAGDFNRFGRNNPWAIVAGFAALGF